MRDDYAAEAGDEQVTKLDNVLYIIIALVNIKTSKYLSKTNEFWNKARGCKKIGNPYVSFDIVTFAIYSNNNGNMVVGEIPEFFLTSPPHAVNVPFISSHIKVSRSSLEPNLSTWRFFFPCGLFFKLFFNLKLNSIIF